MEPPALAAGPAAPVRAAPGARADLVLPPPRGTQPFTYHWSRAGALLDDRFTTSDDAGGVRLTVSAAQTGDTGVYTLQASNAAGSDTSKIRLEVSPEEAPTGEDPPSFLRRLQDLTVKVGSRTRFLVEIISSTECKVTWYRNERRLLEAERVGLARDGNFWCADVAAVSVDDAGRWTCTAENAGGRASCSAHLNVLVPKAYKRPEFVEELRALLTEQGTVSLECKVVGVPTPVLRWFKDSREIKAGDVFALTANAEDPTSLGTYTCEAVNCMGRAYSSSKVHVVGRASREGSARPCSSSMTAEPPPIFTKELEDAHVKVCEHLTLGSQVVVPPWPRSVVWYNKEGKVEPGERYHVLEDGVGGYMLEIPSAAWADEGEWKCVATSAGGRVSISTCHVAMDVPKNYRKPRFMENLQAVLTEEGLVSFECKVVGFPTPVLSWFKDGQELKPGDVYQLTGTNSLGSYCCIARNCMGQASSSAELTVEDIQNQLNEEEKLQLFSKNQAPKFIQGLKSVEAKIDEPFRFTIKVAIPPEPSVLWYRDDQPVDESTRCHLDKEEKGLFNLDIQNLEFLDQAEWKCVAMNDFGHSVTSCFLKLIIPRHYKKPRFLENLQAILSDEGAVNLECKVIGVPQPILKWYKDGEELKPGDIHRIISGQDGTCCLGTYTCEAQNCMGIAASSASLLGFDDSLKSKSKKIEEQPLQRNLSLSTIHEERTSQMYDTPVGDITLDDKGEISFSFDGKEVSVSLYETPDLTEEEALQIVEMYADQLSENVTEHNVVELPPLRFVKETSTSGNLLMEAIIIDVSPDYFAGPEEDLRTEADVEDLSIADDNGPPQLSLDQDVEIGGEDYLEKTMALLTEDKSDFAAKSSRKKSDSQRSADDFYSLSRDQSLSEEKKDDDTHVSESELQSFASARSSAKLRSKSFKPFGDEGQESSEPTKTILLKKEIDLKLSKDEHITQLVDLEQELEVPVVKPKRERCTSRGSRRSSTSSEKSISKSREELLRLKMDVELSPKKPLMNDEEFKNTMSNISASLTKVINNVQLIEREIILKSELMSSAATASRSLEIISSLITPLSEIHSIADAAKESIPESREVTSTIFNTIPQPLKALQQSLTILEKCIDMESDNKTLVKKTCVSFIETCGTEVQKVLSDIKSVTTNDYILAEEKVMSEIDSVVCEITTVIKFSSETIKARNLLTEASEIKLEEPTLEIKHIRNTQKAVFELKSPLKSLLRIVECAERCKISDLAKIKNSEVIMNDMAASIQDLQTALEQIESLSVIESSSTLQKYNTEIIETVMDSVLKLRGSFELLSTDPKIEEDKTVLKQTLSSLKENLAEISLKIQIVDNNVGQFDVLQSENKLDILQKMAQILIALENNLQRLEAMPEVKSHMGTFHKNLTKVLEKVIESNDAKKYITMMEVCDSINIINSSIKNLESDNVLPLASLYNTLKIVQTYFVEHIFESELNCSIMNNILDVLVGIAEAINKTEELSLHIDSEHIQDISTEVIDEAKVNVILQHIDKTIAAVNTIKTIESTEELKLALRPALENICPVLEELRRSVVSVQLSGVEQDEYVSNISEASFALTIATPLCDLNQNIIVFNQLIIENIEHIKENTEIITAIAEPLHELYTTLEILQQNVISQYDDHLTPYEVTVNMASVVQNLQSCIVMIHEQAAVEGADDMSTLEDISGIKTTADTLPSDRLVLPTAEEIAIEQSLPQFTREIATTATAQTLQSLNEHIMVLQTPEIIEAFDKLSEVSDYSRLKSVVVGLADLQTGLQGVLHPLPMEGSIDLEDLTNISKFAAITEPMQEIQQSLSVLDSNNIPIYENILDLPAGKIHSVFHSISEFKNSLEQCMCAVLPAMEITNSAIEISLKVSTLREVCEQLKEIFEISIDTPGCTTLPPKVKNLEIVVDSLIGATDASKDIKIDQVKCITEELYLKIMEAQEDFIQFTAQSPEKISQEAKLIQIVSEMETNIAVLEQYDFIDLSQASDISTACMSPQIAMEIDSESLAQIHDIAENAVNVLHDSLQEIPIADLMIVEDFFKNCKNEFTIMHCLILNVTSHKKIIRLLQEFNSLQTMINNFTTKRLELCLSDDVNECVTNFLLHADECLRNVHSSLIKVIDTQSDMLIETPIIQLESIYDIKYIMESKTNSVMVKVIKTLTDVAETSKSLRNHLYQSIINELSQPMQIYTPKQEEIVLSEKIEELANIVASQLESPNLDDSSRNDIKKLATCLNKHHDYKDASGTGKTLIILKCLAECVTIVHGDVTEENMMIDENKKKKVKENSLKEILVEMLQPLQALQAQLVNIRDQVLPGAEEDSISIDMSTTESIMLNMTEFHNDILQQIELHQSTVDDKDMTLIMEVDKEIHTIQDTIKSIDNLQVVQSVKELAKPMQDIEKSLHTVLSSSKDTLIEEILPKETASQLLHHIDEYIKLLEIVEEISAVIKIDNVKETFDIARELRESIAASENILTNEQSSEFLNTAHAEQTRLAQNFQMALLALQTQVLENAQDLAPVLNADALQRITQVTAQLQDNLVAVTAVQISVQAPAPLIDTPQAVETAQTHTVSTEKKESVVADLENSMALKQVYAVEKDASEEQKELKTELLEKMTVVSQEAMIVKVEQLQQKSSDDSSSLVSHTGTEKTEILSIKETQGIETREVVEESPSNIIKNLEITTITEPSLQKVTELASSEVKTSPQSKVKVEKAFTSLQENLMQHISEYVSKDITEAVEELSSAMEAEDLKQSVNIAKELRENIAVIDMGLKEELVSEIKDLQERQIELIQSLQTALSVLSGNTLESLHELVPSIDIDIIEKVVIRIEHLKSDLSTAQILQQEFVQPTKHELQADEANTELETADLVKEDVAETLEQAKAKVSTEISERAFVDIGQTNVKDNTEMRTIKTAQAFTESTVVAEEAKQDAQVDERKCDKAITKPVIAAENTVAFIEDEKIKDLESSSQQVHHKKFENASATETLENYQQVKFVEESKEELLTQETDRVLQDSAITAEATEKRDEIKISMVSEQPTTIEASFDSYGITEEKVYAVAVTSDLVTAGDVCSNQVIISDESAVDATEASTISQLTEPLTKTTTVDKDVIISGQVTEKSAENLAKATTETLIQNTHACLCDDVLDTVSKHAVNVNDLKQTEDDNLDKEKGDTKLADIMIENNYKDNYKEQEPENQDDQLIEILRDQSLIEATEYFVDCSSELSDKYKERTLLSKHKKVLVTEAPEMVLTETTNFFEEFFDSATLADKLPSTELVATETAEVTILEHPQNVERDIKTTQLANLGLSDTLASAVTIEINVREATDIRQGNAYIEAPAVNPKIEMPLFEVAISNKVIVEETTIPQENSTQESAAMCHDAEKFVVHEFDIIDNENAVRSPESLELQSSENILTETTKFIEKNPDELSSVELVTLRYAEVPILEHAINVEIEHQATNIAILGMADNLTSVPSDQEKVKDTPNNRKDEDLTPELKAKVQKCVLQESIVVCHGAETEPVPSAVIIDHSNLVLRIDSFISEEVTEIVNEISNITNTEALKESLLVAKNLRESLLATDYSVTAEETSPMNEKKHLELAYRTQTLQEALSLLHTQVLDSAQEITKFLSADTLQNVSEIISNLQEVLATAIIIKEAEKLDEETDDVKYIFEQDSMVQLETLLQDINLKINLTSAGKTIDADDSESLKDTLDEVQTVIIKLKHENDGAVNDTLNETLEDLECSVRSVQLQINEESPPELLSEACATLQLLVDNIHATQQTQVSETPFKLEKTESILEKCSTETGDTIKLLDRALKLGTNQNTNLTSIISNLNTVKDSLKFLRESFLVDTDTVIGNGVKLIQCLDQIEDNIFSLEREVDTAVNLTADTRDIIVTAVHSVYGSISNMRSTVSSVQKRYMFENFGKPSESLLHSIKNIAAISRSDSEENKVHWVRLSKSLRKVINHFEDIKFYINLDKTARLPSDAAFTKIILEELKENVIGILVPRAMLLDPNVSQKVNESLKCIKKILISIESDLTLEVKNKIPMFQDISSEMLIATNLIKTYLEKNNNINAKVTDLGGLDIIELKNKPLDSSIQELQKPAVTTEKQQAGSIAEMAKERKSVDELSVTEICEEKQIDEHIPSASEVGKDEKSVKFKREPEIVFPLEKQAIHLEVKTSSETDKNIESIIQSSNIEKVASLDIDKNHTETMTQGIEIGKLDQAQISRDFVGTETENDTHDLALLPSTSKENNNIQFKADTEMESQLGEDEKIVDICLSVEEAKCKSQETADKAECSQGIEIGKIDQAQISRDFVGTEIENDTHDLALLPSTSKDTNNIQFKEEEVESQLGEDEKTVDICLSVEEAKCKSQETAEQAECLIMVTQVAHTKRKEDLAQFIQENDEQTSINADLKENQEQILNKKNPQDVVTAHLLTNIEDTQTPQKYIDETHPEEENIVKCYLSAEDVEEKVDIGEKTENEERQTQNITKHNVEVKEQIKMQELIQERSIQMNQKPAVELDDVQETDDSERLDFDKLNTKDSSQHMEDEITEQVTKIKKYNKEKSHVMTDNESAPETCFDKDDNKKVNCQHTKDQRISNEHAEKQEATSETESKDKENMEMCKSNAQSKHSGSENLEKIECVSVNQKLQDNKICVKINQDVSAMEDNCDSEIVNKGETASIMDEEHKKAEEETKDKIGETSKGLVDTKLLKHAEQLNNQDFSDKQEKYDDNNTNKEVENDAILKEKQKNVTYIIKIEEEVKNNEQQQKMEENTHPLNEKVVITISSQDAVLNQIESCSQAQILKENKDSEQDKITNAEVNQNKEEVERTINEKAKIDMDAKETMKQVADSEFKEEERINMQEIDEAKSKENQENIACVKREIKDAEKAILSAKVIPQEEVAQNQTNEAESKQNQEQKTQFNKGEEAQLHKDNENTERKEEDPLEMKETAIKDKESSKKEQKAGEEIKLKQQQEEQKWMMEEEKQAELTQQEEEARANQVRDEAEQKQEQDDIAFAKKEEDDARFKREKEDAEKAKTKTEMHEKEFQRKQSEEAQFKEEEEARVLKDKEDSKCKDEEARLKKEKAKKDKESAEKDKKERVEIQLKQQQEEHERFIKEKDQADLKQQEEEARVKRERDELERKQKQEDISSAKKEDADAHFKIEKEEADIGKQKAELKQKEEDANIQKHVMEVKQKQDEEAKFKKEEEARLQNEKDKKSTEKENKEREEFKLKQQREEHERFIKEKDQADLKQQEEEARVKRERDELERKQKQEDISSAKKEDADAHFKIEKEEADIGKQKAELIQKEEDANIQKHVMEVKQKQDEEAQFKKEEEARLQNEKDKKSTEKENKEREEFKLKQQQEEHERFIKEKDQADLKQQEEEARVKRERDELERKQKQEDISSAKKEDADAHVKIEKEEADIGKQKAELGQQEEDANIQKYVMDIKQKQDEEALFKKEEDARLQIKKEDFTQKEEETRVKKEKAKKDKERTEKENKEIEEIKLKQQQEENKRIVQEKDQADLKQQKEEARVKQERDEVELKLKQDDIARVKKDEANSHFKREKEDAEKAHLGIEQETEVIKIQKYEEELQRKQDKVEEAPMQKVKEDSECKEEEEQVKKEKEKNSTKDKQSNDKGKKEIDEIKLKQQQEEQERLIKEKELADLKQQEAITRTKQGRDDAEQKQNQEDIARARKEEDDVRFNRKTEDSEKSEIKLKTEAIKIQKHEEELQRKQEEEAQFKKEEVRVKKEKVKKAKKDEEIAEKERKEREEIELKQHQEEQEQADLNHQEEEARAKQERDEAEQKQKQEDIARAKEKDDVRFKREIGDSEKAEIKQKTEAIEIQKHEEDLQQKQEKEAQFKKEEEARVKNEKVKKAKTDEEIAEKEIKEREEIQMKQNQEKKEQLIKEKEQVGLKHQEEEARAKQERDEAEQKQNSCKREKEDTEKSKLKAEIEQKEKNVKIQKDEDELQQMKEEDAQFKKEGEARLQKEKEDFERKQEDTRLKKENAKKAKKDKESAEKNKKENEEIILKQQLEAHERLIKEKEQAVKQQEEIARTKQERDEAEHKQRQEVIACAKKEAEDATKAKLKAEIDQKEKYFKIKKYEEELQQKQEDAQFKKEEEEARLQKEKADCERKQEVIREKENEEKLKIQRTKKIKEDERKIEVHPTQSDIDELSKKSTKYTERLDMSERRDDELHIYKTDYDRQNNKENGDINHKSRRDVSHGQHYIREYQYEPSQTGHKLETRENPKFIDHSHRDYTMEFARPSGYRERFFDVDKTDTLPLPSYDHFDRNAAIYRAQTILLDSQLRSSAPPYPDTSSCRTPEPTERCLEIRHRSKALSEARSIISEKRTSLTRDSKRKPVFSTYLTDRTAVEGSRVKLTCSVLSSSDPTVTWYKNGVLLDNKLKYRTKFMDGLITLEVLNAIPSDSAEYSCTIVNANGSVSSSATLKVYPSFEASPIPPTFTRSIRDNYHLAENELVLECRIRGQPLPTITWLKDDKSISNNSRYQAYYLADGVCRLAIEHPTPEDGGKYTCKAENSVWSDQITHIVNFTGRESRLSPNIATIEKSRFNRQAMESRRPHFTNVLSDYKVVQGGTIGLQVEIRGAPTRVEWLREGCSVTEVYRNAKTFVEHGLYTLALSDVTEKESGMYTCRAWSSQCHVDMNAAITVVQPNELDGKPAIIVGRPEKDILISVGEDVNISFRVQGEPRPKVVFMKGIRDITTNQRVCKMTSDDYVKFTLKRSGVSDAGTYCILARNAYGCDRAFVTVVVRQRASSDNLISDWTYPIEESTISIADRKYKSVPERIPGVPCVVEGGNNWISLGWPKSEPGPSAPVLAYKVESWLLGKEGGARWVELGITPLTSFDAFNLKQGEEYHFRVTPRNRYGWGESIQTSSPIGVGLAGDRPEFSESLPGTLKVLVGETANLSCSVKGKPVPEVVWMKNGHEIEDGEKWLSSSFNGNCCLTIKDINIEDEARYSCEATNEHGRASTYARLAVVTDRSIWEADAKLKRERSAVVEGDYPPQFTMRLRDRRVQATYPVRLTCQVIGSPDPGISWYKDGEDVKTDSRRSHFQDEHFHTLEIAPTTLEDGGVYEAMARNSSGAVSCRCSLVVDKGIRAYVAPEFCCGLEPLYQLTDGEELRISAVVEAYPSVGVTWYRDGVRLRPSRRAIMTLDRDGQIELALAAVTSRDAGVYTCTASNEVGRASTSGKVEVSGTDVKRSLPIFISPDEIYSKEPMFIRKPRSSEAREGDTVIIACEVVGDPKPDVYWLRDFLKPDYYRDSSHFKRMGDGPEYRFEIPHAKLDYTGAYSVVARNQHGEAKAVISLQILAKDPSSSDEAHNVRYGRVEVLPRFVKELTDLLSCDGDAVQFECRLTGHPEPHLRWYHYNELIRDCPDFETSFDDGTARLKIKQVTAEDEGTYTCEAANNLGKVTSSACLVVYPPGEPNTLSQRLRRPPAFLSAASTPRSTPRTTPARSISRTPGPETRRLCSPARTLAPSFYTYLFNKVAEEGDSVTLQCAIKGNPAPWATWDKDGIIITPSSRITIKEKDDVLRVLEIDQVTIEDVGVYRITIENELGRQEASARIEVITQRGKFYAGVRAVSPSPRKSLTYRGRRPSTPGQD